LEITKIVLSLILACITISTTLTTIAAYAGGDNDDENQQKAEDESQAALADCDENDVEEARFLCIALAANDVEIEERATLSVCKEVLLAPNGPFPEDFDFTVTGNGPFPDEFAGVPPPDCVDVDIGPGEYTVSEVWPIPFSGRTEIEGDCVQDSVIEAQSVTGEIQAGETQECRFRNFLGP
jgi:hypothetical protein